MLELFVRLFSQPEFVISFVLVMICWSGSYVILSKKVHYIHNYFLAFLYFVFFALLFFFFYKGTFEFFFGGMHTYHLLGMIIYFLVFFLFYEKAKIFPEYAEFCAKHPQMNFLKLDTRFFVSKSAEIFFQQTYICLMIYYLAVNLGFTFIEIVQLMMVLLVLLHALNYFFMTWQFATYFLVGSAFAGFVFPHFILQEANGFFYTYIVHFSYYLVGSVIIWSWMYVKHELPRATHKKRFIKRKSQR